MRTTTEYREYEIMRANLAKLVIDTLNIRIINRGTDYLDARNVLFRAVDRVLEIMYINSKGFKIYSLQSAIVDVFKREYPYMDISKVDVSILDNTFNIDMLDLVDIDIPEDILEKLDRELKLRLMIKQPA